MFPSDLNIHSSFDDAIPRPRKSGCMSGLARLRTERRLNIDAATKLRTVIEKLCRVSQTNFAEGQHADGDQHMLPIAWHKCPFAAGGTRIPLTLSMKSVLPFASESLGNHG